MMVEQMLMLPPNRLNEFSEYQFSVDNLEAI